jgi:tRNA uridine 5-carboxymethylaminomethyl modification enzyme
VGADRAAFERRRAEEKAQAHERLAAITLTPNEAAAYAITLNRDGRRRTGLDLLAHPEGGWQLVDRLDPAFRQLPRTLRDGLEADALYRIYTDRQKRLSDSRTVSDGLAIPRAVVETPIPGLSAELQQKLAARKPKSIGEARRISGMTPAGLALIAAHARRAAAAA